MNQTTGKKRVKKAAAAAVLSAAAIIIILVCVWNASSKNRTVDALNENASKAEATTSKAVPTSKSLSKQDEPKEKLRKELSEAKAKLSAIKKEAEDIISDESVKASSSRLLLSFQEPSHIGRALLYYKRSFFNDMFWI